MTIPSGSTSKEGLFFNFQFYLFKIIGKHGGYKNQIRVGRHKIQSWIIGSTLY